MHIKLKENGKIQLSAEISFISQKPNSNEIHVMFTRRIPEEFMIGSETEEFAEKLIMSILQKYQDNLQNKMRVLILYLMELIIYTMILIE